MNVVELFYFVGFLFSAFIVGRLLGKPFGTLGWVIGSLVGLTCWGGLLWCINILVNKLDKLYPARPTCCHGKCSARDYSFLGMKNSSVELQCCCGDKYILKGNRFIAVDKNGILHPFMARRHSLAHWEKDDSHDAL